MVSDRFVRAAVCAVLLLVVWGSVAARVTAAGADVKAAIASGDFAGCQTALAEGLVGKLPAQAAGITATALEPLVAEPAVRTAIDQWRFSATFGADTLAAFAKGGPGNADFLGWVMTSPEVMDAFLLAAVPTGFAKRDENASVLPAAALGIWKAIHDADPDAKSGMCLRLAMATALAPPPAQSGYSKVAIDPLSRYRHFKAAEQAGELADNFKDLTVWEYSKIVCADQSDEELAWGRRMIDEFRPDLRAGGRVVEMVSSVWRRNSPVPYTGMQAMLQGGGKCGPRSTFGVFINRANGIPAIGVAQPAHACVAWRALDGVWQVGYGKGWAASRLDGITGPEFVEGVAARASVKYFSLVEHIRWLGAAVATTAAGKEKGAAILALAQKMMRESPASVGDLSGSFRPEEAEADPGATGAAAAPTSATVAQPPAAAPQPARAVDGVIRVTTAAFSKTDGEGMYGGPRGVLPGPARGGAGVSLLHFPQAQKTCWAEFLVEAPRQGVYEIVLTASAVNDGQVLEAGSEHYNKTALIRIPMSHGLWTQAPAAEIKLLEGVQTVRIATMPNQRGVSVASFELRPKPAPEPAP